MRPPASHPDADVARSLRILRVLTLAFGLGIVTYTVVAVVLLRTDAAALAGTLDPGALGWVAAVGALLLLGAPLLARRVADGAGDAQASVVQSWLAGRVVALGLADLVGIGGVTLSLLADRLVWAVGFGAVALAALALGWPREDALRDRLPRSGRAPRGTAGRDREGR